MGANDDYFKNRLVPMQSTPFLLISHEKSKVDFSKSELIFGGNNSTVH
jgi:hypothetical protein